MLLDPAVTDLNAGGFGPLPRRVFDRVTALRASLACGPMNFLLRDVPALLWEARERLAAFVGGDPHNLAFTTNVTEAVNLIASALPLAAPGEILLTDQEYTPMRWCWERAAKRQGLLVRTFRLPAEPADPDEIVQAAAAAMSPRTRLFFFSHVVSSTGLILPARRVCDEARRLGITTVVDGAQAPGFTEVNVADLGCDFYAGSGHKWLLAPSGVGFLYFGAGTEDSLWPLQVSWAFQPRPRSGQLDRRDRFGSTPRLRQFECEGTRDLCPWLAVPEAIAFQAALGHLAIRARMRELAGFARRRLTGWRGLAPATPDHPALSGAMTAFRLPAGTNAAKLRDGLWERFRIEAAVIERTDHAMIRVSTHFYNTEAEVERLAEALKELLGRECR